jgi:hypothetical protein
LIFGLEEYKNKRFCDMLKVVGDILREVMKLEMGVRTLITSTYPGWGREVIDA